MVSTVDPQDYLLLTASGIIEIQLRDCLPSGQARLVILEYRTTALNLLLLSERDELELPGIQRQPIQRRNANASSGWDTPRNFHTA